MEIAILFRTGIKFEPGNYIGYIKIMGYGKVKFSTVCTPWY